MNQISQNGMKVTQTENSVIVNGREYPLPEKVKSGENRMTMINGRITVNGYVLNTETGEFSRPLSFWLLLLAIAAGGLYYYFSH